ncbi:uncharacterized protein LOC142764887 [Rhipicephalus microplus]|uniref:uncharacterized protein LOC142764887 n=1 Tax=Rhipicephalus microplus TaxID=6941 RepID=UPI002376D12A
MYQGRPASHIVPTPTERGSLDRIDGAHIETREPVMSSHLEPSSLFQDHGHEDLAEPLRDPDAGRRSQASSVASTAAAPVVPGNPPTTDVRERVPDGGESGWASAFSKEAIFVLGIVVALCFLLVALIYLNLSHREGL